MNFKSEYLEGDKVTVFVAAYYYELPRYRIGKIEKINILSEMPILIKLPSGTPNFWCFPNQVELIARKQVRKCPK